MLTPLISQRGLGEARRKVEKDLIYSLEHRRLSSPPCFSTLKTRHIRKLEEVVTEFAFVKHGPLCAFVAGRPQYTGCLCYYLL